MKPSLKGKHIVLTRSGEGNERWVKYLEKRGAIVHSFPMIKTRPVTMTKKVTDIFLRIGTFDWIVLTSAEGVRTMDLFIKKLHIKPLPARMMPIAVVGKETARTARTLGYRVKFKPSASNGKALARELTPAKGRAILLLRADAASKEIPRILIGRGGKVTKLSVYKTKPTKRLDPRLSALIKSGEIDYLTFGSLSALEAFWHIVDQRMHKKIIGIPAVAIGPEVAKILKQKGFKNILIAEEPSVKYMAEAML